MGTVSTAVVVSSAVRSFTEGFWETEAYRLPRPCAPSNIRVLMALLAAGRKVVFVAFREAEPHIRVPIELVAIKPTNEEGDAVILFECVRDERLACGIADLTTGEIVLGFEGVPI